MTFKPAIWFPVAVGLSLLNLAAVGFAAEPWWHATSHAALALAFGLWAQRLRRGPAAKQPELEAPPDAIASLEDEVNRLRQGLSEAQERLDFAERMLVQRPDPRRVNPER